MVLTILMAALAALGVLMILLLLGDALTFPFPRKRSVLIVPLRGGSGQTEQIIRGCLRLRRRRGIGQRLIFVDEGLDQEGQVAAALLLCRETEAMLCAPSQIPEMIRWEKEKLGAGTD